MLQLHWGIFGRLADPQVGRRGSVRGIAVRRSPGVDRGTRLFSALALLALISGAIGGMSFGLFMLSKNATARGNIQVNGNFGLYSDLGAKNELKTLVFGNLSYGNNYFETYIKNNGNVNMTLQFTIKPANSSIPVTLTENYTGTLIKPGQVIPIQWDIDVTSATTPPGLYTFGITITSFKS